jgi:hypothetical protein
VDFFKAQRSACCLDGVLQCTESFENSQNIIPMFDYPIRDRTFGDNSEHIIKMPLERISTNSFFFDGISLGAESVRVIGNFMKDEPPDGNYRLKNNYYILNRHNYEPGKINPETGQGIVTAEYNVTAPLFITVHDTFGILGVGQKAIYNITSTFNEVFSQNYPDLFTQLLNAISTSAIVVNPQNADAEAALL